MGIEAIGQVRTMQMPTASQTTVKAADNTEVVTARPERQNTSADAEVTTQSKNYEKNDNKSNNNSSNPAIENERNAATEKASNDQLKKAIEQFNKKLGNSEAIFGVHEDTNRVTIKIIDKDTKEVLKELPPEKTLDMIARVWEMAGILIDEKR